MGSSLNFFGFPPPPTPPPPPAASTGHSCPEHQYGGLSRNAPRNRQSLGAAGFAAADPLALRTDRELRIGRGLEARLEDRPALGGRAGQQQGAARDRGGAAPARPRGDPAAP